MFVSGIDGLKGEGSVKSKTRIRNFPFDNVEVLESRFKNIEHETLVQDLIFQLFRELQEH